MTIKCQSYFLKLYTTIIMIHLFFNLLSLGIDFRNSNYIRGHTIPTLEEDSSLETPELIKKYSYPSEIHKVETEDGYILEMHRITNEGKKPIFLQHGLADSSATFVFMGPKVGLGYYLWNQGYDVWMGNFRGNRYSQNHKYLNPNHDFDFWNFSWHEMGVYDLPAMIDYVLQTTKNEKLYYIGHSQGTTAFFVLCVKRPEYNEKIQLMQAIAPVGYLTHIRTPFFPYFDTFLTFAPERIIQKFSSNHGMYKSFCTSNKFFENMCIKLLENVIGEDYNELNRTMVPVIFGHVPAGLAVKQLKHYVQVVHSKKFIEYDYGVISNLKRYSSIKPPTYDLSSITAPIVFHYSLNDFFTHPIDVNQTYSELGNPKGLYLAPNPQWNHMDFIWSPNAPKLFYKRLLIIFDNFNFEQNNNLDRMEMFKNILELR